MKRFVFILSFSSFRIVLLDHEYFFNQNYYWTFVRFSNSLQWTYTNSKKIHITINEPNKPYINLVTITSGYYYYETRPTSKDPHTSKAIITSLSYLISLREFFSGQAINVFALIVKVKRKTSWRLLFLKKHTVCTRCFHSNDRYRPHSMLAKIPQTKNQKHIIINIKHFLFISQTEINPKISMKLKKMWNVGKKKYKQHGEQWQRFHQRKIH